MIVVKDESVRNDNPFEVHAFVCDSRAMARRLTYALAASFQEYSRKVKEAEESNYSNNNNNNSTLDSTMKRKFAIDLRSPEELQQEHETEAWWRRWLIKLRIQQSRSAHDKSISNNRKNLLSLSLIKTLIRKVFRQKYSDKRRWLDSVATPTRSSNWLLSPELFPVSICSKNGKSFRSEKVFRTNFVIY